MIMESGTCKATLENLTQACDRTAMEDREICAVCAERVHHAMIGRLYRYGKFEFAAQLDQLYRKEG